MTRTSKAVFATVLTLALTWATGCAVEDAPIGYYSDSAPAGDNVGTSENGLVGPGSVDTPGQSGTFVDEPGSTGIVNPDLSTVDVRAEFGNPAPAERVGTIDPDSDKSLTAGDGTTELPAVGNYIFESVEIAGVAGVVHHDSSSDGATWIGSLKLDALNQYRLVAHQVSSTGTFERSIEYVGLYQARTDNIDFADESGRALFRMGYSMYSTDGRLFLNHDAKHGQAEAGDIVGIVARHL